MEVVLPYTPHSRQVIGHLSDAREIFYGGAAGGGKSAFARWDLFDFCLNCPRLFAVLFRESAPQLKANHIEPFHRELANVPNTIIQWNETNKEFRFHNGSLLVFRHLGDNQAMRDIQGWEIHMAAIDEASLLDPQAIAFVKSRMRLGNYRKFLEEEAQKNPRINEYLRRLPRLILTSNPGGPSHLYLKDNYISPAPPEQKFEVDMDGDIISRVFIPAKMKDNPLLEAGYRAQFADLPEYQRKQLVEGDWNVVPGAYFDCWSEEKHVIEPFAIPPHWTRFRSMDWGYATPFSVNWFAVADETPVLSKSGMEYTFKPGSIVMYREWYGAQMGKNGPVNKGLRLAAPEVARRVMAMESGERISYGVADPSMWRSDGGVSVAEQMEQEGLYWTRAANERAAGATLLYSRLNSGLMYVFRTCPNFIRTLPTMVSDDKKPEEYKKEGQDHCVDSVRYAVMSRPELSDAPDIPPPSMRLPTLDELKPRYGQKWI